MNIKEYIHKLQQKPVQERKKIAVVATAVGFAVILLIWVVSFNEMNKPVENQGDPASASLDDLKDNFQNNFQTGKDSIQDMIQELPASPTVVDPSQTLPAEETGTTAGTGSGMNSVNTPAENDAESVPSITDENLQNINSGPPASGTNSDQKPSGLPQLP